MTATFHGPRPAACGARGQQAPDSIPFEALAGDLVGGNVGAAMAGQDEFGEPPGLVPAVVGG